MIYRNYRHHNYFDVDVREMKLDYIYSDYQADHPLFVEQRVDSTFRVSLDYQQYFAENWSWLIKAIYIDNQSELVIYDYQRTIISTAVRYQF